MAGSPATPWQRRRAGRRGAILRRIAGDDPAAIVTKPSGVDWGLGPAVHRLSGWSSPMPDRAEMNPAIVRLCKRVVPLRTVNGSLNGGARMPDDLYLPTAKVVQLELRTDAFLNPMDLIGANLQRTLDLGSSPVRRRAAWNRERPLRERCWLAWGNADTAIPRGPCEVGFLTSAVARVR